MPGRAPFARAAAGLLSLAAVIACALAAPALAGTLDRPIDPRQQTDFGARSHWLQPWRAYLDTRPARFLRQAVGINFNVDPNEADAAARLLAANGFTRARVEIGFGDVSFDDSSQLRDDSALVRLRALKRYGIRPLILLNSWSGAPCPRRTWQAVLAQSAPAGATSVRLDAASAAQVRPGRSGFDAPDGTKAATLLFTGVAPDGTVTLSRPLPYAIGAGPRAASTLMYPPFAPPELGPGRPNPAFDQTMNGWLSYVGVVTRNARQIFGSGFDLEIWNELSFGSDYLFGERYYATAPPGVGDPTAALLARTVAWLRDPANGVPPGVGIGDGFTSQSPFDSGATVPAGVTAIDKHPYKGLVSFPADSVFDPTAPLDALGREDYSITRDAAGNPIKRTDRFIPRYDAYLPEYWLTAIQTEHLIRDLSPFTTEVYGTTAHGRAVHPVGGTPPTMWVTETGMDPSQAGVPLDAAQTAQLHAKATLRALVSYVSKGASAIDFFAAKDPTTWGLVDQSFFDAVDRGGYPGDGSGGATITAVGRLTRAFAGRDDFTATRALSLDRISDTHNHFQFAGDGTPAHPPLYDRDVVAFFPFQTSATRYVIPTYVMTRDIAKALAPEGFRITVGGLPAGGSLTATATDPLTGAAVPVSVSRSGTSATLGLALTDSPRVVTLDLGGHASKRPRSAKRRRLCTKRRARARTRRAAKRARHRTARSRPAPFCRT